MSGDRASLDGSRRRLLVAGVATGLAAGGLAVAGSLLSGNDCSGPAYRDVPVRPGGITGPIDGESYCRVHRAVASRLGVAVGDQLRLRAREPTPDAPLPEKLFTVAGLGAGGSRTIRAGPSDLAAIGFDGPAPGAASAAVPHPCYGTEAAALEHGEFVEVHRNAAAADASLVALAPHGGFVEPGTGSQAEHVADRFELPAWICYGATPGDGAFDRWHVSSVELSERSFPALRDAASVGYDRAIAFHGRRFAESDPEPFVGVGGRATRSKHAVVNALREAYAERGVETPVCVYERGQCRYDGSTPGNVVNRVTDSGDGGVQLEQPRSVRESHAELTARVAVEAILGRHGDADARIELPQDRCPC